MGRVFTPEQIRMEKIPRVGDMQAAGRHILGLLIDDDDTEKVVHSALVYGSVAMGQADMRSDLDLLVNYESEHHMACINRVASVTTEAETVYSVAVEAQLYEVGDIPVPQSLGLDPFYAAHLLEAQNLRNPSWHINFPVDAHTFQEAAQLPIEQVREICYQYLVAKTTHFTWPLVHEDEDIDYHVLQRTFELPTAIGRKILPALYSLEQVPKPGNESAMKEMVRDATKHLFEDSDEVLGAYNELEAMDRQYSRMLEDVTKDLITLDEYETWINNVYREALRRAVLISSSWSRELLKHMQQFGY